MRLRHAGEERGQVIILVALGLPLFLALLLLAIDGGRLFLERQRLGNASLLAAEAAASLVAQSPEPRERTVGEQAIRAVVEEALRRNLGSRPRFTYGVSFRFQGSGAFDVRVRVERPLLASIQRVSFTIAGEGAAQLPAAPASDQKSGRSPVPSPGSR